MHLKAPVWVALVWMVGMFSGGCARAERLSPRPAAVPAAAIVPPLPAREFRGVWIATVDNIDWPSRKDLSTAQQKAELLELLDRAAKLKLNAIVFQVRPQCDALYASTLEPWSEFLTGQMGRPPNPFWDPLAFVIEESHKRGMELHAWFNPYRALHPANKGAVAANHISRTKPQLIRPVGSYLWLDPGEREVREYVLAVVMDVVKRYDVDGVHFDDYFYPYPEKDARGQEAEFPDEASWKKFGTKSKLNRADWRRENVNEFVERVYHSVKAEKPWVKFGISPFGIWRPGFPMQVKGFDQYEKIYADARRWLVNGWVDYLSPQLYWQIDPPAQSFPALLNWWNNQNPKQRHIWPGLALSKLGEGWKPDEIVRQVRLTERQPVSAGQIYFSMKHFVRHPAVTDALQNGSYAEPALIPALPWLAAAAPMQPNVSAAHGNSTHVTWTAHAGEKPNLWVLQFHGGSGWKTEIFPGNTGSATLHMDDVDAVAVSAVNRVGTVSSPSVRLVNR